MKFVIGISLLIMTFGTAALAQESGPPPAPVIYSAPKKEEVKEFVSSEDKFKISFAGTPTITKHPEEYFTTYTTINPDSSAGVTVAEVAYNSEEYKEDTYRITREGILEYPDAKITEEKYVQIGTRQGKEFTVIFDKQGMSYLRARILPVGQRIYEIKIAVVNWHLISDDKKKEFEAEAQRFLDSFRIIEDTGIDKPPAKTN